MLRKSTWLILLVLIVFAIPITLFTQDEVSASKLYSAMDRHLQLKNYDEALPLAKELIKLEPNNSNYNFKMAYTLIKGGFLQDPIPFLEKAAKNVSQDYRSKYNNPAAPIEAIWFNALQEMYSYNYLAAKPLFEKYLTYINEYHPNYKSCKESIASCVSGYEIMKTPVKIKIIDFSEAKTLNSSIHSPIISPDGSVLIFTADEKPEEQNYQYNNAAYNDDIFYIYKDRSGKWSERIPLSQNVNSEKKEASVGIHPNGKQLLVYREDNGEGNLYYSDYLDSKAWSPLKKFPAPINSKANETHATISADGKIIFFTSDREGGYGGLDIYMSRLSRDGVWGPAINLGPSVNTKYIEEGPHIQANSNLLYFSSNRPGGMGEFDIYRAEIKQETVVENVQNMGYPINTPQSDLFFKTTLDGGRAYYSSQCNSSDGQLNIQIIEFLEKDLFPNVVVKGVVLNKYNDTLRGNKIQLFNKTMRDITEQTNIQDNGYYTFNLHSKNDYFISIYHEGFVYFSNPFKLSKYFADYSFENIIELDAIHITESTMCQEEGMFNVFVKNINKDENDSMFDTVENLFVTLNKFGTQKVSRNNSSLVTALRPEPIVDVTVAKPDENELIADVKPEKNHIIDVSGEQVGVEEKGIDLSSKPDDMSYEDYADAIFQQGKDGIGQGEYSYSTSSIYMAFQIYDSLGNTEKGIDCLETLTDAQLDLGELNDALELQKKSLELHEKQGNVTAIADKQEEVAGLYSELFYLDEALDLYKNSLEIQKELKNEDKATEIYYDIADAYLLDNQQEQAIKVLEEALEFNKSQKKQAEIYNRLGVAHHQIQDLDRAIKDYKQAVQIAANIGDDEGLALNQNNLGNAYYDLKEYDQAHINYSISLGLHKKNLNDRGMSVTYYNIGNTYKSQGKYNSAINNLQQSIDIALKIDDKEVLAKNYFSIAQTYKLTENYSQALNYYKRFFEVSVSQQGLDKQLSQLAAKHIVSSEDVDLLQAKMKRTEGLLKLEKAKYEKESELLEQETRFLKITQIVFIVVLIGVAVTLLLLFFFYRTRSKYLKQLAVQNAEIIQKQEEITAQKENLEAINQELEKLSIVASKTANSVAILQGDASFEWINNSFIEMYNEFAGSLFDFATTTAEKEQIQKCISQKESVIYEAKRTNSKNKELWMQCMLTPVIVDGEIYKIILIESDITEQKNNEFAIRTQRDEIQEQATEIEKQRDVAVVQRTEIAKQKSEIEYNLDELKETQDELIESEKMASLGNLVAGISHEINTPVGIGVAATSSLNSRTELIVELFKEKKMKQSDLEEYLMTTKEAANLIQSNLTRTANLVKSFKRVSVDEMTDEKRVFKLKEYMQEVVTSMASETSGREIKLDINCAEDLEINSYPSAFVQIITNMMRNVLMYAYKPNELAEVNICAQKIEDKLHFTFSDKGAGMSDEVRQKVFNPFFTTNMQAGKGLGMTLVYNTVNKQLQGEISCQSSEGKGTMFKIVVPV